MIDVTNEFGETVGKAAAGPWTAPAVPLLPPYEDVKARVVVSSTRTYGSVRLQFTQAPNLGSSSWGLAGALPPGRHNVKTRLDGDLLGPMSRLASSSNRELVFDSKSLHRQLASGEHRELSVSLNWHRSGLTGWTFSLEGASEAIQRIGGR